VYGVRVSEPVSPGAVARASEEWWRPTATLARFLEWSLGALAALNLVLAATDSALPYVRIHRAFDLLSDHRDRAAQHLIDHAFDGTPRVWTQLSNVVSLAVLVLLIVWTYRSATNAQALGRNGARLGPLWAIFGWFIPLASFVLPYIVIQDLWRSSDPDAPRGDGWRTLPGSTLVRGWWALRVVTWVAAIVVPGMAVLGEWGTSPTETWLRVFHGVAVVLSVLAIFVVRGITARQAAQQAADPAPTSRPAPRLAVGASAAATIVDGPGWYADPSGHFDHRYWDGTSWTEHVSTAGQPSTAPVTPPDWYPDPTGEFHWRYWTGHAWTEHVSRDGQLFLDPPPNESQL
jgi:Domain of unknown function (DUF4328)/Protein of unknown function (DUF2510)